ncbi:hypothetical protein CDO73_22605 [Saccharibacillus sp. O23]|uniref:DUF5682 family protein n=1 Tax=Saccharibacillus sp. O23 TaxID=2009338 RepID=UPI000B4E621F|nr:DUF5682 family protein [Saccharibacillus sp. O23]OWR27412.1 hypothetical protein CDO73_22605 [Saccharibacillus sp. O23]
MDRLTDSVEAEVLKEDGEAGLLRQQAPREQLDEIDRLFAEKVFDLNGPVVHFPIRHHSPACSRHLLKTFEAYRPDIVLIEGPESGTPLIPVLADAATQAPVSLYYGFEDENGRGACYYPLLDYSPEYAAIRAAAARGIPARFIDLDVRGRAEAAEEGGKASAQDEALLAGSAFIGRLCRSSGARSFDELWERAFEVGGLRRETPEFVRSVFAYCTLSRMTYSPETLRSEGDLDREARMRAHIAEARAQFGRVLVVTGGFHTYGLIVGEAESGQADSEERSGAACGRSAGSSGSPRPSREGGHVRKSIYPMVYTFEEADRLNGYASGMPHVGYYDRVWTLLQGGEASPYERAGLELLARLGRDLRSEDEAASTSDGIEAFALLQGLAALRGKSQGGAYELTDAVTAAFIKGERTRTSDKPLEKLLTLMTGDRIGSVAPNEFAVPIVEDFKARAAACRLNLRSTGRHRRILEPYAKPAHREASRLLHCAEFLGTEFARKESGPDWAARKDMNLVREIWTYSYSSRVEARLIENSIYGGTVAAAAEAKLVEQLDAVPDHHSGEAARRLLQALTMGLESLAARLFERLENALRRDGSFLSLCETLDALERILSHRRLLGVKDEVRLNRLADEAYAAAVSRLPGLGGLHPDDQPKAVEGLKLLHMHAAERGSRRDSGADEQFRDRLGELLAMPTLAPRLEGAAIAVLVRLGERESGEIARRARAYLLGTTDQALKSAEYLQGVFALARDALMQDDALIADLSLLLERLPHEEFLRLLPELRLAFTFFTPPETSRIATKVAALHGIPAARLELPAVDERTLLAAKRLDQAIREELASWKLEPEPKSDSRA